jgi:hypothetical protein
METSCIIDVLTINYFYSKAFEALQLIIKHIEIIG